MPINATIAPTSTATVFLPGNSLKSTALWREQPRAGVACRDVALIPAIYTRGLQGLANIT